MNRLKISTAALALVVASSPLAMSSLAMAAVKHAHAAPASQTQEQADPVVAIVNGMKIHRSELVEAQKTMSPQFQQLPLEVVAPILLDNRLIPIKLLAAQGRKMKLQDDAEAKRLMAEAEQQILANLYVERAAAATVTDAALHKRYQEYAKKVGNEEEVKARHILVDTEAEAKAIIAQLDKGADFATLAREKSKGPSAKNGGELGWFRKSEMVPEFADAAFKLNKGQITQTPVKTQFGWHVIQVEDRRKATPPSFDDVKEQLKDEMTQQAVRDIVKNLKAKATIVRFNLDGTPMKQEPAKDGAK